MHHVIPAMIMKFRNAKLNNIKTYRVQVKHEEFIFVDDMAEESYSLKII